MNLEQAKSNGIPILDKPPNGWVLTQGTLTEPNGYRWWNNGKSSFSGERRVVLVKEES